MILATLLGEPITEREAIVAASAVYLGLSGYYPALPEEASQARIGRAISVLRSLPSRAMREVAVMVLLHASRAAQQRGVAANEGAQNVR